MHLDDEQVHRFLDAELDPTALTAARAHLVQCPECRGRVERARREEADLDALLEQVDHPAPTVSVEVVVARAVARETGWLRRAAVVIATLGLAGVAYAIPGSPVRAWVDVLTGRADDRRAQEEFAPVAEAPRQTPERIAAGIAVAPGRSLVVQFTAYQAEGQVRVSLTDSALVEVRALGAGATFSSEVNRLAIANQGSGASFEIGIPRRAAQVEIRIGDRRLLLKQGDRVTAVATTGADGLYVLPLQAPKP